MPAPRTNRQRGRPEVVLPFPPQPQRWFGFAGKWRGHTNRRGSCTILVGKWHITVLYIEFLSTAATKVLPTASLHKQKLAMPAHTCLPHHCRRQVQSRQRVRRRQQHRSANSMAQSHVHMAFKAVASGGRVTATSYPLDSNSNTCTLVCDVVDAACHDQIAHVRLAHKYSSMSIKATCMKSIDRLW